MALRGVRVLELAGLAPAPFCGMILADYGATVVRIDRTGGVINYDVTARGKKSVAINLKKEEGTQLVRKLSSKFDVLLEPFRPGVMEKLGLGPEVLMSENPGLVYARLTGYGQSGPYSSYAGHDINYLAVSGILSKLGRKHDNPTAPLNLLADFAGGGLMCAMGIMAALLERTKSGQGQIVDASMVEGSAYVGSWVFNSQDMFVWGKKRGENFLDTGSHFYDTYKTKDEKYLAVGAIEPQFYAAFIDCLQFSADEVPHFGEDTDALKSKIGARFLTKTRDEWMEVFGSNPDSCVMPVLELEEAPNDPHNLSRGAFVKNQLGKFEPVPAPRLNRTPAVAQVDLGSPEVGQHSLEILKTELNLSDSELETLLKEKIIIQHNLKSNL